MRGWLLRLSYRLSRHYIGSLSAGRWIVIIGALVVLAGLLPRVQMSLVVMIVAGACALLTLALLVWGKAVSYCHFRPYARRPDRRPAEAGPMRGLDKVDARATGWFAVEGRQRFFANLQAIYHSFESREHAVMAHAPLTRFAGVAEARKDLVGMWYTFFTPAMLESVVAGELAHGAPTKPAVRITYRGEKRSEVIYLAFESEADQARVIADLLHDAGPGVLG